MNQNKTQKTNKKKRRPLRRAQRWGKEVPAIAFKLLGMLVLTAVLGLVFSALQAIEIVWLRALLSLGVASGLVLLLYFEGMQKGTRDAASSRHYDKMKSAGRELTARDDAACYQPLKTVCAGAAVYGIPLLMAVYIALNARPYTYTLQDLPAWLTGTYGTRADVMAPLGAYMQATAMGIADWIRMIVRLFELVFVGMVPDPLKMTQLVDRLSPLMILVYPAAYVIGYLRGPANHVKVETMNRRAKKVAVHRAQKKSLAQELISGGGEVHYGHRADTDKPKRRKELI